MSSVEKKNRLRRQLRSKRQSLTVKQQAEAGKCLARQARGYWKLFSSARILSYSPFSGEIDPAPLLASLRAKIFLPRIINYRNKSMQFLSGQKTSSASRFGITEPVPGARRLPARHFDAVLVPLVAFDRSGTRLGMGAGYYDRSFAFKLWKDAGKRPLLIGLAHHFQEGDLLTANSWDVPLDAIITDRELIIVT